MICLDKKEKIKVVYTALSKYNFYARKMISAYVLKNNYLPLNPFTNWDYFLSDMVDRDLVVRANNNLIYNSQELWQFGCISDGCLKEIELAMSLNMTIRFFKIGKTINEIFPIDIDEIEFEDNVKYDKIINKIKDYKYISKNL